VARGASDGDHDSSSQMVVRTTMKKALLTARLVRANRVRSYHIRPTSAGWEASAREDERLVQERSYSDWHRVERTLERFRDEIAELRAQGWRDA
jgi:hypothetical protein